MNYHDYSDKSLMALVCSGHHDAFAVIVSRHTDRYFALAFRTLNNASDAEDIVQNAFIKLWQKPASWNSDKSQFTTWFYRVVINACHDHIRKNKPTVNMEADVMETLAEPIACEQVGLEQSQIKALQQKSLSDAMSLLPSSQRDALNLVVYLAIPQKQVAEIMGITVKAVESLLVRAKRSVAKTVNQKMHIQPVGMTGLQRKSEN